jgi:hypothetical protein
MAGTLREARLIEDYGELYPGLSAGVWLPAGEVAEHIVAVVRREGGRAGRHGRLMADEHFEFRGGETGAPGRTWKERREDLERSDTAD